MRFMVLLVFAGLALAACGGEEPASSTSGDQARDAGLKFARCMREQGVDMPDPQAGEDGGLIVRGSGGGAGDAQEPSARMRKADAACRKYLKDVKPPKLSAEQERKLREQALEHARCMREQGIDFPDPQFGSNGEASVQIGEGGVDMDSPAFRSAQEKCGGGTLRVPAGAGR